MQYGIERIRKDLVWYLAGAFLPMVVLLLRSPIFTRVFSPAEYGQYTLVSLVFLYLSVLKLEWIRTSIWRYYLKYKKRGLQQQFWNAVSAFFMVSAALIVLIAGIWLLVESNEKTRYLIGFGALNIVSQELITILMITKRIEGKSAFYNIINASKTTIAFLLLLVMAFVYDFDISAFFLAPALVNMVYLVFLLYRSDFVLFPRFSAIARTDVKRFFNYGLAGTLTMGATFLLISSDRWIINYFWGLEKTGIYNQTYILGQMSIMAIITVLNASFNPYLINNIESKRQFTDHYIANTARWYLYIVLPMAVYISLYARPISVVLLGPAFREAWNIIPLVTFGFMLDGLCHFSSIKLKFFNKLSFLYLGVFIATIINVGLNLYLIPRLGYTIAAFTTLFSYLILFLFYYFAAASTYLHSKHNRKFIIIILAVLSLQVLFHFTVNPFLPDYNQFVLAGVEFVVFALLYVLVTFRISPLMKNTPAMD